MIHVSLKGRHSFEIHLYTFANLESSVPPHIKKKNIKNFIFLYQKCCFYTT